MRVIASIYCRPPSIHRRDPFWSTPLATLGDALFEDRLPLILLESSSSFGLPLSI